MKHEFEKILSMAWDEKIVIERVRLQESGVAIEGEFDLPALAQLSSADQTFVTAFVCCHGSIKEMEKYLGVSYPTIKNRLRQISEKLNFVAVKEGEDAEAFSRTVTTKEKARKLSLEDLEKIERGEATVDEILGEK